MVQQACPVVLNEAALPQLGLALSRQIMTLLGGSLSLADKAKGGYHVTFVLGFERR